MQQIPLFSGMTRTELGEIASRIIHRDYAKGSVIIGTGDRVPGIAIVNTGEVKACRYLPDGREQILYLFSEGDFFGERSLYRDDDSPYQVEALSDVKICHLYRADFQELLANPAIALRVISELGKRLARLESFAGSQDLDQQIPQLLLELTDKYGREQSGGLFVRLPLSREGIANYLGIARETVSRKLSQLESDGVIRPVGNKTLWIRDRAALARLADPLSKI